MNNDRSIAYFSMEIGLEAAIPTYSGGLGILAGDTIRSLADLEVPAVAVTLLHRKGYFYQQLDDQGNQSEEPVEWDVQDHFEAVPATVEVTIRGRQVRVTAWRYDVIGYSGHVVPVYFLDTDLGDNAEEDRKLTHHLYGGDDLYRLCQEAVLGIGGVRMLRALGYAAINRFHMNEGHASLLTLQLMDEYLQTTGQKKITEQAIDAVRRQCIFTTHTPVPAGHDQFPLKMAREVVGSHPVLDMKNVVSVDGKLNMTYLALSLSRYINGVAKKHGEVSRKMFAPYPVDSITNGVHAETWTSEPFHRLFDKYIPGWREDNFSLRYALEIPADEVWLAHKQAKQALVNFVNERYNAGLDMDHLTLGFARRATAYKRPDMIFYNVERLRKVVQKGPIQIVYAGKAHPRDKAGKEIIQKIFAAADKLKDLVKVVYIPNYDIEIGKLVTAGVDIWLNNPMPPMEASGTSGMKAALNGVPSLSILDGWWIEGHIEGVTGWSIGESADLVAAGKSDSDKEANAMYDKLEETILPMFYNHRQDFITIMCHAIALNGSFFNTQRMVQQYVLKGYFI